VLGHNQRASFLIYINVCTRHTHSIHYSYTNSLGGNFWALGRGTAGF
jgi:hypothetical protein